MIKKFKFFFNPITDLTEWLNNMSNKGYRLINVGNVFYYFEECGKSKYEYDVDYIANKSYEDLLEYENFLDESNIRYIEKAGSIGKISMGNVRWRPYADKGAKIATSGGMIKREFLILEKEKDNKLFEIYSTLEDKIQALKIMRKPIIAMNILITFLLLVKIGTNIGFINEYRWSLLKLNIFPEINNLVPTVLLIIIELLLFIKLVKFNRSLNRIKEDGEIQQ